MADADIRAELHPGWVDVLDAQQPGAVMRARIQVTGQGCHHRAGMQRPAGRGGEAANVGADVAFGVEYLMTVVSTDTGETEGGKEGKRGGHGGILTMAKQARGGGRPEGREHGGCAEDRHRRLEGPPDLCRRGTADDGRGRVLVDSHAVRVGENGAARLLEAAGLDHPDGLAAT